MLLTECDSKKHMPDNYKNGLLSFVAKPHKFNDSLTTPEHFGELWVNFNQFNIEKHGDTIIADVNTFLKIKQQYKGGFEFNHDTLLLYSCKIAPSNEKDSIFSTLTYKILSEGKSYKIVYYRELN